MQIQNAPVSQSARVIVVAARESGGYWDSINVRIPSSAERKSDAYALAEARDKFMSARHWAEARDEHYYSLDGEDVTRAQAEAALTGGKEASAEIN